MPTQCELLELVYQLSRCNAVTLEQHDALVDAVEGLPDGYGMPAPRWVYLYLCGKVAGQMDAWIMSGVRFHTQAEAQTELDRTGLGNYKVGNKGYVVELPEDAK